MSRFLRVVAALVLSLVTLGAQSGPQQMLLVYAASAATPIFTLPLQSTLVPTLSGGSSTPTFARTSVASVYDWEGVLRTATGGVPRLAGARLVNNLVDIKSEDWTNAAWIKTIGTVTATTLTATGANQTVLHTNVNAGAATYRLRVRMSRITGSGNIQLTLDNGGTWMTVTLTGSAQVFSISQTTSLSTTTFGIRIVTSGDAINADQIQVEDVTGQSNTNPSEYVSVGVLSAPYQGANVDGVQYFSTLNGNTVSSNVVTEATGAAINLANGGSASSVDANGPFGYLSEPAATNLAKQSQDISNAAWTHNSISDTIGALAPDGTATGNTIKPAAANLGHYYYQQSATNTTVHTISVYAKAGTANWVGLGFDVDAKTDGAFFNVATGAIGTVIAGCTATISGPYANGYYRITATRTYASGLHYMTIEPHSADNQAQIWNAAGTETVVVWGMQMEGGANAASYIKTVALTATRNAETLSYAFASNAAATVGTAYAELRTLYATQPAVAVALGFASAANGPLYSNAEVATTIRTNDGTNNVGKTGLTDMSTGVRKRAASWTGSTLSVTGDGATAATGTFDGDMGSTAIYVGRDGSGASQWNGYVRNVKIYSTAENVATLTN